MPSRVDSLLDKEVHAVFWLFLYIWPWKLLLRFTFICILWKC